MDYLTKYYMKRYADYLAHNKECMNGHQLADFSSIYEHTFVFLLTQGIDEENAWRIIDDFKGRNEI